MSEYVSVDRSVPAGIPRKRDYTARWKAANRGIVNANHKLWIAAHPGYKKAIGAEHVRRINAIKAAACVDCGGRFPPVAMDFDHVRGEKAHSISKMVRDMAPWKKILDEIAKCDLVCANCHRVRTSKRGDSVPHKHRKGGV